MRAEMEVARVDVEVLFERERRTSAAAQGHQRGRRRRQETHESSSLHGLLVVDVSKLDCLVGSSSKVEGEEGGLTSSSKDEIVGRVED